MVVAIIGENNFKWSKSTAKRFKKAIAKLIEQDGMRIFLFSNEGNFDLFCWLVVTELRVQYPEIQRVFVRKNGEEYDEYPDDIKLRFDTSLFPNAVRNAGLFRESVRNEAMVNMCDMLVTHYDAKNLRIPRIIGYAETASEQAQKMNKRVINLYK